MVRLKVNGKERTFDGDPEMPLLWYLRDVAGLTGTKFGCGVIGSSRPFLDGVSHQAQALPHFALCD